MLGLLAACAPAPVEPSSALLGEPVGISVYPDTIYYGCPNPDQTLTVVWNRPLDVPATKGGEGGLGGLIPGGPYISAFNRFLSPGAPSYTKWGVQAQLSGKGRYVFTFDFGGEKFNGLEGRLVVYVQKYHMGRLYLGAMPHPIVDYESERVEVRALPCSALTPTVTTTVTATLTPTATETATPTATETATATPRPFRTATKPPVDADGDGYSPPDDCDDGNPDVHPGAQENPNTSYDDNCNGDLVN
jgi:hypothetical protein